jgi:transcriptional regulator with XRE-family HTH domain
MDPQHLAEQVFTARRQLKISQSELARLAGISRNYVSIIERGEASNVSMNILEQLAAALSIAPAALSGEQELNQTLIPPALREFALAENLSFDVVDRLAHIPRRGAEPQSAAAWAALYEAIRPYLDS